MQIWLIHGVFFQEESMGLGFDEKGDVCVTTQRTLERFTYAGSFFWRDGNLTGSMLDQFGESQMTNIFLAGDKLAFEKKYHHRVDRISYRLKRSPEHEWWEGEYKGDTVGKGKTRCLLTLVSPEFLHPS